jgi:hypothetical protein
MTQEQQLDADYGKMKDIHDRQNTSHPFMSRKDFDKLYGPSKPTTDIKAMFERTAVIRKINAAKPGAEMTMSHTPQPSNLTTAQREAFKKERAALGDTNFTAPVKHAATPKVILTSAQRATLLSRIAFFTSEIPKEWDAERAKGAAERIAREQVLILQREIAPKIQLSLLDQHLLSIGWPITTNVR